MIHWHNFKNTTKALSEYILMPQNKALKARIYAKDFIKTLDERISACIEVGFVKKNVLYLQSKHSSAFVELKHSSVISEIQNALNEYARKKPHSEFAGLKVQIQAPFDAFKKDGRTKNKLSQMRADEKPLFERSNGEFKNAFEPQSKLFESFERLRKSIKKHNELLRSCELQDE